MKSSFYDKKGRSAFRLILTFLLFIATLGTGIAHAAPDDGFFEFKSGRKKQVVPFRLVKNLMVVPMTINGQGPYNFVLDTGVGLCLITDPALLNILKPTYVRDIRITGFGEGSDIRASVCVGLDFELGQTVAKNMSAAILKEDAFNLSGLTGIKIHGLIGYELFSSFIVKINYLAQQITLYRPNTYYIPRKGSKIPITIEERKPYINAEIELESSRKLVAKLILDTGAGHPVSLETDNGVPFPVPPVNVPANLGIGLSGPIFGYLSRIRSLKLSKYELKDVITAFPDYDHVGSKVTSIARNGNMGTSILKRFTVVFDYSRGAIYLRPTIAFKEPFEHNMSGMDIISGGSDFSRKFIMRVEQGSPAEEAGLMKDDELISVNFKRADEMTMEELDEIFRSKDGRSLLLEVLAKGQTRTDRVILTLKRRI